jgi:hypothetical protein
MNIDNMVPLRFGKLELLNSEQFKDQTKTLHKDFSISCTIVAPIDGDKVKTIKDFVERMNGLSIEQQGTLNRSISWLRKGAEATDEERFIYRWISLESLCGMLAKVSSTQKMLNCLIHEHLSIDSANDILDCNKNAIDDLSKAKLEGWQGSKPSEHLMEAIRQKEDSKAILGKATLCVFEVRNSLFHRGQVPSLLGGCSAFLRDLVDKTIIDILLD